jgi:hypothetical protein
MERPEPLLGLILAALLLITSIVSYVSHDVVAQTEKIKGKSQIVNHLVVHPQVALWVSGLSVLAGLTIIKRNRALSGVVFFLLATIGINVPLPNAITSLRFGTYLLPALYGIWLIFYRARKQQRAELQAMRAARSAARGNRGAGATARGGRAARPAKAAPSAVDATGRTLPVRSGRYTPPKSGASQRRR